jgi:uncharacterized membrane protein
MLRIRDSPESPLWFFHRRVTGNGDFCDAFSWGYIMNAVADIAHRLHEEEIKLLAQLRAKRREAKKKAATENTMGDRVADWVAATMGSWNFIIIQSVILFIWIVLNVTAYVQQWDPYPFILLNLVLSFQAAYAAPVIMMSQNRQAAIDRQAAQSDYQINAKAELEIELLHQKLDLLRETEVSELIQVIRRLEARLPPSERAEIEAGLGGAATKII